MYTIWGPGYVSFFLQYRSTSNYCECFGTNPSRDQRQSVQAATQLLRRHMAAMRAYKGRVAPLEVLAQLTFLHSKPPTHMPKLKMVNQRPCPIAMMNNIASIEGNALVTPLAEPPPYATSIASSYATSSAG